MVRKQQNVFHVWGKFGRLWKTRPVPREDGLWAVFAKARGKTTRRQLECTEEAACFQDVAVSPDENQLAAVDNRGTITLLCFKENRYARLGGRCSAGACVEFSPRNKQLLFSGHCDGTIRCYSTNTKTLVGILRGHRTDVHALSFTASGDEMISVSKECVVIWSTKSLQRLRVLGGAPPRPSGSFIGAQCFRHCQDDRIVTACCPDWFMVWNAKTLDLVGKLKLAGDAETSDSGFQTSCFGVSPNGKWLVAGGQLPLLFVGNLDTCEFAYGLEIPSNGPIRDIRFFPDSATVAVLCGDRGVQVINVPGGLLLSETANSGLGERMSLDARGNLMALNCKGGKICVYDLGVARKFAETTQPTQLRRVSLKNVWDSDFVNKHKIEANIESPGETVRSSKRSSRKKQGKHGQPVGGNFNESRNPMTLTRPKRNKLVCPDFLGVCANLDPGSREINRARLQNLLECFGEYPSKYRLLIWEFLLQIPHNSGAFDLLANKGLHSSFKTLSKTFPIPNRILLGRLARTLSQLAHYCPVFGEATFLAPLAFPFVKMIGKNEETCFEILLTILLNWGSGWFQAFPRPPTPVLVQLEALVSFHDPDLFESLSRFGGGVASIGWSIISTLMSDVVSKQDWLKVWDHLITNAPHFLHYMVLSLLMHSRDCLMELELEEDRKAFLSTPRTVDINKVIQQAYQLRYATPDNLQPDNKIFTPIPKAEAYPAFKDYPRMAVDSLHMERERIQAEEEALVRRKWLLNELEHKTRMLERTVGERWRETEHVKRTESEEIEKQRATLRTHEQEVLAEKVRLEDRMKEARLQQLRLMEEAYRTGLEKMGRETALQSEREQEEILHRQQMLRQELMSAREDEKLQDLEIQAQQRMLALEQEKYAAEAKEKIKAETNTRMSALEARQKNLLQQWCTEDQEAEMKKATKEEISRHVVAMAEESKARIKVEEELRKAELEQDAKLLEISNERQLRRAALDNAERIKEAIENEKKKEEIMNVQNQAFLRAKAEEDMAWFDREKSKTELRLKREQDARDREKLEKERTNEEFARHARMKQSEVELVARRRKLEQMLLAKVQEVKMETQRIEEERRKERGAEVEMRLRQEEVEERMKHAIKVGQLQKAIENDERLNMEKLKTKALDELAQEEAQIRLHHQEIMNQLAKEREKQILELDTLWRREVRKEETAVIERERRRVLDEQELFKSSLQKAERHMAAEVGAAKRQAHLARHKFDPSEPLMASQILSDGGTESKSSTRDERRPGTSSTQNKRQNSNWDDRSKVTDISLFSTTESSGKEDLLRNEGVESHESGEEAQVGGLKGGQDEGVGDPLEDYDIRFSSKTGSAESLPAGNYTDGSPMRQWIPSASVDNKSEASGYRQSGEHTGGFNMATGWLQTAANHSHRPLFSEANPPDCCSNEMGSFPIPTCVPSREDKSSPFRLNPFSPARNSIGPSQERRETGASGSPMTGRESPRTRSSSLSEPLFATVDLQEARSRIADLIGGVLGKNGLQHAPQEAGMSDKREELWAPDTGHIRDAKLRSLLRELDCGPSTPSDKSASNSSGQQSQEGPARDRWPAGATCTMNPLASINSARTDRTEFTSKPEMGSPTVGQRVNRVDHHAQRSASQSTQRTRDALPNRVCRDGSPGTSGSSVSPVFGTLDSAGTHSSPSIFTKSRDSYASFLNSANSEMEPKSSSSPRFSPLRMTSNRQEDCPDAERAQRVEGVAGFPDDINRSYCSGGNDPVSREGDDAVSVESRNVLSSGSLHSSLLGAMNAFHNTFSEIGA